MNKDKKAAFEEAGAQERSTLFGDLLRMARENKKYWLIPLILLVLGLGGLLILGSTGAAPFIYTLF